MPKDQQLTSVKINKSLFEEFKVECIKRKFSFQKLSERIQTANLPGKPMEFENWMFGDKDGVSMDHALDFAKEQVRNRKRNLEIQADKRSWKLFSRIFSSSGRQGLPLEFPIRL